MNYVCMYVCMYLFVKEQYNRGTVKIAVDRSTGQSGNKALTTALAKQTIHSVWIVQKQNSITQIVHKIR